MFAIFTWDDFGPPREMDIEISRWGEPEDKNAQYVIQPYIVPANTVRFTRPRDAHILDGLAAGTGGVQDRPRFQRRTSVQDVVAEHVFTSGVPSPATREST